MQPPYWLEKRANACWGTVLAWGCFSKSRSLFLTKPLWYWDICAVMNSLSPKERLQREMRMPGRPSEKGPHLSPPLASSLAKTYDSSLSSLQPFEPFLPGCVNFKLGVNPFHFCLKPLLPTNNHILFQKQQQTIKAKWALIQFFF